MPYKNLGPPCSVCGKPSIAKRLCEMHYRRLKRHGHLEQTRPADWGAKSSHPLHDSWLWTKRVGRDPAWNDFWRFVSDVGERPTAKHTLRRHNQDRPCGPSNWFWAEPISAVGVGDNGKAARNEYARKWRAANPLLAKQNDLRKMYGIELAEYEALLAEQHGGCAICGQQDQWFSLAVDHCHGTKRVRGLLCSQCNRGLGLFRDKPELLERAAEYLRFPKKLI